MVLTYLPRASLPSPTGLSPSLVVPSRNPSADALVSYSVQAAPACRKTVLPPCCIGLSSTQQHRFGLLPFRSPLLGESSLFLGVLRCFSSPSARSHGYVFTMQRPGITRVRLPHSETRGSARSTAPRGVSSPCHVLRRPQPPRHPPRAFCPLTCTLAELARKQPQPHAHPSTHTPMLPHQRMAPSALHSS